MAKWSGYLTLGFTDPDKIAAEIDACFEQGEFSAVEVEPARIFNAAGASRRRLEVWNQNRTHVRADNECRDKQYQSNADYVRNYIGDPDQIRLAGGYQVSVTAQGPTDLLFRTIVGGGELGVPTDEIPLFPGEAAPPGSDYLDGGVSCDKVLRSINGVSTPHFTIATETGVVVKPHSGLNRIVINVNGEGLNYCPDASEDDPVDCLPASKDHCGPATGVITPCPGTPDGKGGYLDNPPDDSGTPPTSGGIDLNALYGTCTYRKTIEGWSLQTANPAFNCQCRSPVIGGYLDQVITTRAAAMPYDEPWYVRNGSFIEAMEHWQVMATSHQVITDSDLLDDMPFIEVVNGELKQPLLPIEARLLKLQAQYICDAEVTARVINARTGAVMLVQVFPIATSATELASSFFSGLATDVTLTFVTTGTLKITEIGLIPWQ